MFKKLFHSSMAGKPVETSSPGSYSESTLSEGSHATPSAENTQPEKRFFLRRPSKLRSDVEEPSSYFRSFDPFAIKSNLKRSKSFPFKVKTNDSEPVTLGIPKSKSVHFAENLATYHEFKAGSLGSNFNDYEATFEEFLQLKREQKEGESESDESSNDPQEVGSNDSEEGSADTNSGKQNEAKHEETCESSTMPKGTIISRNAPSRKKTGRRKEADSERGMKLAGQHLQSMFGGLVMTGHPVDSTQPVSFDNSDSTDVDSDEEEGASSTASNRQTREEKERHESQDIGHDWFLYHIYEQLSDLAQQKARQFRECDTQQLKTDISCGIADLGDSVGDFRDQLTQSKKEICHLRRTLQEVTQDRGKQAAAAVGLSNKVTELEEILKKQTTDIEALKDELQSQKLESERMTESSKAIKEFEDLKVHLELQLQNSEKEIATLREKLSLLESVQNENALGQKHKEELMVQLDSARKHAKELQSFQEKEREIVQEETAKLKVDLENARMDSGKKVLHIEQLESSLQTAKAATEQKLNEASLMINELGKRYEEKKTQMSMIIDIVEDLVRQFSRHERMPSVSQPEPAKRKPSVQEKRQPMSNPEFERILGLLGNLKDIHAELQAREGPKLRDLEQRACSNRLAMESLAYLIKASFDILFPIFHKESANQFKTMYNELSKSSLVTDQNQHLVMFLCNYLLNAQRELLHQQQNNEKSLEKEMQDRLKYQQQVLDSFTRIVRQVIDNNRNSRVPLSGIRGHSSPKKKRLAKG